MIYLPTGSSNGLEINKPSGGGGGGGGRELIEDLRYLRVT